MLSQISKWYAASIAETGQGGGNTGSSSEGTGDKEKAKTALNDAASSIQKLIRANITQKSQLKTGLETPVEQLKDQASALKDQCPALTELKNAAGTLHTQLTNGEDTNLQSHLEGLKLVLKRAANKLASEATCTSADTQLTDLKDKANALKDAAECWFHYDPLFHESNDTTCSWLS